MAALVVVEEAEVGVRCYPNLPDATMKKHPKHFLCASRAVLDHFLRVTNVIFRIFDGEEYRCLLQFLRKNYFLLPNRTFEKKFKENNIVPTQEIRIFLMSAHLLRILAYFFCAFPLYSCGARFGRATISLQEYSAIFLARRRRTEFFAQFFLPISRDGVQAP